MEVAHENRFALRVVAAAIPVFSLMLACFFAGVSQAHAALSVAEPAAQSQLAVSAQEQTSLKLNEHTLTAPGATRDSEGILCFPYTGQVIKPHWDLRINGKKLVEGYDYDVTYLGNVGPGRAAALFRGEGPSGEYKDAFVEDFLILPNIAHSSVSGIANKAYTGKAQKQSATLKHEGTTLKAGTDYTVSYKNNVSAGTATVTFTGKGNYAGKVSKSFKIMPASISKAKLALRYAKKTYTGKAQKQSATLKLGGTTLKAGTDYAASYKKNVNVGVATVTFTGKGNYAGKVSKTFKIMPASISKAKLVLRYAKKTYTGKALKPTLKTAKYKSVKLKKGKHYTLSYKANKNIGKATVIVKGKGNFKGTKKLKFAINPPVPKVKTYEETLYNQRCITASWSMNSSVQVDYYTVRASVDPSFLVPGMTTNVITIKKGTDYYKKNRAPITSGKNIKIEPNTTYYMIVAAHCKVGGKEYSSDWSDPVECKTGN